MAVFLYICKFGNFEIEWHVFIVQPKYYIMFETKLPNLFLIHGGKKLFSEILLHEIKGVVFFYFSIGVWYLYLNLIKFEVALESFILRIKCSFIKEILYLRFITEISNIVRNKILIASLIGQNKSTQSVRY